MDKYRDESAIKRNRTFSEVAYFLCWIVMIGCAIIAVIALNSLTAVFTSFSWVSLAWSVGTMAVFGGLAFLIWRKKDELRVEYDYTFTNGDLDVGKVFGNSRRRLMTSLNMKNVEAAGSVTHPSFQRYLNAADVKKHNWFVNRDSNLYYFYFVKNNVKHVIVLELSDEMIEMLKPFLGFGVWQH